MSSRRSNGEGTTYYNEKRKRWEAQASYKDADGKPKRKLFTGKTQREANKKKNEFLKNIDDGLMPESGKLTTSEWLDRWLEDFAKTAVRTKSYEKYCSCLKYVKAKFGDVLLTKLTTADIQRLFNELLIIGGAKQQGVASITVRNTRRCFIMALDKAVQLGLLIKNPAKLTDAPKLSKIREIKPLTALQANELLQTAKNRAAELSTMKLSQNRKSSTMASDYDLYVAIAIALNTGMRLGEILGLKVEDLQENSGKSFIAVRRSRVSTNKGMQIEQPKTGKGRKILISYELVEILKAHRERQEADKKIMGNIYEDNQWIIGGEFGRSYESTYFSSRKFKSLLARANIDSSFTFHDLRHTHATILLLNGVNPKIVQERLGHATVSMTLDTYSHLLPENQESAVDAIDKCFLLENEKNRDDF